MIASYDCGWQDIAHMIAATQRRCRVGLVQDPLRLAKRAHHQAIRVSIVAADLGVSIEDLRPDGQLYEGAARGVTTIVRLTPRGLLVERAEPTAQNGLVCFSLPERQP